MGVSVTESAWVADTLDADAGIGADDSSWAWSWTLPARNAAMLARSANSDLRVWTASCRDRRSEKVLSLQRQRLTQKKTHPRALQSPGWDQAPTAKPSEGTGCPHSFAV